MQQRAILLRLRPEALRGHGLGGRRKGLGCEAKKAGQKDLPEPAKEKKPVLKAGLGGVIWFLRTR